ncbi:MAG: substrate-binding domain-containing protein [Planctomycetota bacterium]|nr:substrate-binding domain-containing protein [Planctomycetota bacterium]
MITCIEKNSDRLEREIRNAILSGAMKPGERLMRVKDLAQAYQITYGQAQRAIKRLEKEGLIVTRRGDGTFVRHRHPEAAAEKNKQQKPAAFLLGDRFFWSSTHEHLGIDDVLRGMERVVTEAGFWLRRVFADETEPDFLEADATAPSVVVLTNLSAAWQRRLRAEAQGGRSVIILFGSPQDGEWALACDADGAAGMRMALQHLADLGHRRIAFVSWEDEGSWWQRERENAYRVWMQQNTSEPRIFHLRSPNPKQQRAERNDADDLLAAEMRSAGFTAALCVNDIAAQRLHTACQRQQIAIPEDISLVGFDDQAWALREGITTLQRPSLLMGELLGEWLVRCQYPGNHACRGWLAFKPHLVVRSSTAAPRA